MTSMSVAGNSCPCAPTTPHVGDYTDAPLPHGRNLVAALVRLERSRSDADAEAVLGALDAWLSESGNEALRRAVGEWMRQVYAQRRSAAAARPDAENRTEVQPMLRERMQEWMAAKWAEGRAEGQLELMRRMAARKFGGETAQRLAERLEPVHDAERLAEIGEWLFECGSGEELLERLERTHASVPDGQEPERQPPNRYAVPAASMAWRPFDRNRATALIDRCMAGYDLPADAGTPGRPGDGRGSA